MKKLSIALLTALALTSCAKKPNPLLAPDAVKYLSNDNFYDDVDFPIKKCGYVYAGYSNYQSDAEKVACKKWATTEWSKLTDDFSAINRKKIAHATFADFTDAKLWQAVYPKDKS